MIVIQQNIWTIILVFPIIKDDSGSIKYNNNNIENNIRNNMNNINNVKKILPKTNQNIVSFRDYI